MIPMKSILRISLFPLILTLLSCASREVVRRPEVRTIPEGGAFEKGVQYGLASWYGRDFHGRPTASGEIYNMYGLSAAHRTLPLGTIVKVTNLKNGRDVKVVINDRGPFVEGRLIDLSYEAAKRLDMVEDGVVPVRLEVLGRDPSYIKRVRVVDSGSGRFVVQVGSFLDPSNAKRLKEALRWNYKDVYIEEVSIDGRIYYRVRVGSYDRRTSAMEIGERLAREGYPVWITRSTPH